MDLYGQAHIAKTLNDQKNIERNYWRIFRELEEANKTIEKLKAENNKLKEAAKKKPAAPKKAAPKKISVAVDDE